MKNHKENPMKRILKKIRLWLRIDEPNWWDRPDAGPAYVIEGQALAEALRRACFPTCRGAA